MADHIPYRSRVELNDPSGSIRLPEGVGGHITIENGIRGTVTSNSFGLTTYVKWADGNEGPCPVASLTVLED